MNRLYELMVDATELRITDLPLDVDQRAIAAVGGFIAGKPPGPWPSLNLQSRGAANAVDADMAGRGILSMWSEWAVSRFAADFARSGRLLPLHIDGTPYHALAVDLFADGRA